VYSPHIFHLATPLNKIAGTFGAKSKNSEEGEIMFVERATIDSATATH